MCELIGKYVLVRTYSAGVHVGKLVKKEGDEVTLDCSRRIWQWFGANTCSEIATDGIDINKSKVAKSVNGHIIKGWIEIIPCTDKAVVSIEGAKW